MINRTNHINPVENSSDPLCRNSNRKSSVLYISYDGMLEPLGQSQVLAYLEQLAGEYRIALITFEKENDRADKSRMAAMHKRLDAAGIEWTPLSYHKTPTALATAWDIAVGILVAVRLILRHKPSILHARSYVPALMVLCVKPMTDARFLFDMRGFWADERVDGGLWPKSGRLYRITKSLEKSFMKAADHIVTLTRASEREIQSFSYLQDRCPQITVIPTCADLRRFKPQPTDPDRPFTFGYVGSVGTWYLFDETLAFFKTLLTRIPEARFLVVNRNEHEVVRQAADRAGIPTDRLELVAAEHREMPALIAQMHAAGALIKPAYSKMASAPTKLAEYLGCGVPCVGNVRVGDMEEILEGNHVGLAMKGFSTEDIDKAVDRLLAIVADSATSQRCVETALALFSLEAGVKAYRGIYDDLASNKKRQPNETDMDADRGRQ